MTDSSWVDLTSEIASLIPQLRENDILILSHGEKYVQWHQGPDVLTVEAVSTNHLPPELQLTPQDEEQLTRLGWQAPGPPGDLNWWRDWPLPVDSGDARQIAETLITTLRDVFKVVSPADLDRKSVNG